METRVSNVTLSEDAFYLLMNTQELDNLRQQERRLIARIRQTQEELSIIQMKSARAERNIILTKQSITKG